MFKSEFEAAGIEFSDEEVEEMSNALQGLIESWITAPRSQTRARTRPPYLLKVKSYSMTDMQRISW